MLLKLLTREAVRFLDNVRNGSPVDLPMVARQSGVWNHADLDWLAAKVNGIPATRAIDEFLATGHGFERIALFNQQMSLRKKPGI